MGTDVSRWADPAQFSAAPVEKSESGLVTPRVYLLWMTPDPLGAVAAMCRMYKGFPTYSLSDISDEERSSYWEDALSTHLKAPLEAVKVHFFIEGVDRSFTHQMVRQRTAVYAQESLRFAVKENLASEAVKPPTIVNAGDDVQAVWNVTLELIETSYNKLVTAGIPAEDARALLPHCVATRLNYVTDLRALADHAGNRLCTQAQFHWRQVFAGIVNSIRNYYPPDQPEYRSWWDEKYRWQFEMIAGSVLFRPVCYQLGHCPFKASFDRACKIRERVDYFAKRGVPSSQWGETYSEHTRLDDPLPWGRTPQWVTKGDGRVTYDIIPPIRNEEWLLDVEAARVRREG